jgi:hydroxymethylglutaryl-CoA reductase
MQKRGGGILDIILKDKTDLLPNYFQLHATFETKDSMGAFHQFVFGTIF